jgi:hypothetical protein
MRRRGERGNALSWTGDGEVMIQPSCASAAADADGTIPGCSRGRRLRGFGSGAACASDSDGGRSGTR